MMLAHMRTIAVAVVLCGVAGAVVRPAGQAALPWPIQIAPAPAGARPGSALPQLTVSPRGALLSWVERDGASAALKWSERRGGAWSAPQTVASGGDWFVNWADVPSVLRLADGTLAAHWLQKSGPGTYAYDMRVSQSTDDGRTWSAPMTPHGDATQSEHGFASLFQAPTATLGLVWLDGRAMKPGHGGHGGGGDMALRYGVFSRDRKQVAETALDTRTCECCPTAAAVTADGPIVAYRDRGPDDTRDIYVARLEHGKWSAPTPVHKDGWIFPACPVNGPALSARGRDVAIAWFTGANGAPRSFMAFSTDAGRTFGAPILLDDAGSLGRVDVALLPDGSAAASYIAVTADKRGEFRVRRVARSGAISAPVTIAAIESGRTSGYPRLAASGDEIVFAWTEGTATTQLRTAAAKLGPR
jgi:hypothetical protein